MEATYSAVSPLSGPPPQRSYARTAAFLSAGLATVCVVALAVHSAERGGLSANSDTSLAITKALRGFGGMHTYYRSGEFGQTRQLTLSKHLQSLQGANTTGNATDTSFDLSAWLDSQPKGTWAEWVAEHPEQQPYDLNAYLNSVPKYDLDAYLNGQPQPSEEEEEPAEEEEEEEVAE